MKSSAPSPRRIAPASLVLAFSLGPATFAVDGNWTGAALGTWDGTDVNWSGVAGTPWDSLNGETNRAVFATAGATPVVGGTVYSNGLSISQTATISGGSISLVGAAPVVDTAANATISSVLTGVGSALTKTGAGTLTLSGANDYTGGTTISAGVLSVSNLTNTGASHLGDGTFTLDGGTLRYTGPAMGTNPGWTRAYTLGANGGTFDLSSATGTLWIGGAVSYSGSGPRTLTVLTSDIPSVNPDGRLGSSLGDGAGGATSLVKNGAGTLILSGANTYTGQLQINQGTVQYGNAGPGGESSGSGHSVSIANGANLTFRHGATDALAYSAPISGAGTVTMNSVAGSVLTLSGASTYTGATTLTAGTVAIGVNSVGSVGSITSGAVGRGTLTFNGGGLASNGATARTVLNPVTFSGNASLGDATNTGKLTFSANSNLGSAVRTLTVASDTQFDGVVSGSGGITKTGSGTLILANSANTYTGVTTINAGVLSTGVLASSSTASGIGQANSAASNLVIDGGTLRYTGAAVATWNRPFTIGANGASFDLGSATGSLNIAGAPAYSGSGARTLTITTGAVGGRLGSSLADAADGATSLVKSGSGTLIISGTNTYTGQLQVLQGTAQLGNAGLGGGSSGVGHSVAISNGATLSFRHASNSVVAFNAPISGEGGVNFNYNNTGVGGGSLVLGGNNTFSGGLTVNPTSGTAVLPLKAGSTTALGSGNVTIGQYGTLDLNGFSNTTGLLVSTGTNGRVTNEGAANATLTLNRASGSQTYGGTISDGATNKLSLTKAGAGSQTLSGANTYTGDTRVEGGTLTLSGTGSIANTSTLSVATGAAFTNNSSVALSKPISVGEGATINGSGVVTASALTFAADLGDGLSSVSVGPGFGAGGALTLNLTNVTASLTPYSLFTTSVASTFTSVSIGATALPGSGGVFSGTVGEWLYSFDDSLDQLTIAAIPEPGAYSLLAGSALLFVTLVQRRRRSC
jgi:autotransporter-associated beta strand protein